MRKRNRIILIGSLCVVVLCLTPMYIFNRSDQEKKVQNKVKRFSLAEIHGEDYPTSIANQYFADLVKEKTGGGIEIQIYNEGQLGDEIDVIEELQYGTIGFARISIAPLSEYLNELTALMLPYLYSDSDHMWRVLESDVGNEMIKAVSDIGLLGLAWYDSGARSFYFNSPVYSFDELAGKKLRVQSSSMMFALVEALNCEPKVSSDGSDVELNNALLSKALDGAENNIPTYESFGQYKVCPYYLVDEHTRIPDMLVGSEIALSKLSEEERQIIKECAKLAGRYEKELWKTRENEAVERLIKEGVQFITLSEEEKEKFIKACDEVRQEFGNQYHEILSRIEALR